MSRSRRLMALLGLAAVLACCLLVAGGGGPVSAASNNLVPDHTTGLQNGAAVTLTATGYKPGKAYSILQCRQGSYPVNANMTAPVAYQGHQLARYQADCDPDQPNSKVDNSGRMELGVADPTGRLTIVSYVHEGTLAADRPDVTNIVSVPVSFTCDASNPCTLVVMDAGSYATLQSVPITFAASASTACAAPTDSTATGVGPFSMTPTYQRWAAASCATGTASPLLVDYTDTGEAAGLTAFASGQSDYAVSATGFATAGGNDIPATRPAVFTPLAAQAAVIAFDGNSVLQDVNSGLFAPVPITDLSLTMAEVAALFDSSQGTSGGGSPAIVKRNPELTKLTVPFGKQATIISPDGVIATPDATVLAMTSAWAALPGSPWTHGVLRSFPSSLGTSAVDTSAIPLLSNLPALSSRVLGSIFTGPQAPAHQVFLYLTDSATAAQLGLRVVKLQNASNAFVAPTPESIAAGVKAMKPGPDGVLVPDPANADPAAYPLPLVQYAVSPTAAFDATHRTQLLSFLRYATGTGQRAQDLAPGVFPLTADLQSQAVASLALIGSTTTPRATTLPSTTLPAVGAPPLPALPGGGAGAPVPHQLPVPQGATPAVAGAAAAAGPTASPTAVPVAIPAFTAASASPLGSLLPAAGVVLLAMLLCAVSYATSGRPMPMPIPRTARSGLAWLGRRRRSRV